MPSVVGPSKPAQPTWPMSLGSMHGPAREAHLTRPLFFSRFMLFASICFLMNKLDNRSPAGQIYFYLRNNLYKQAFSMHFCI